MAPLIVIVGPTASGKTSLAIELAQKYNGEIICADSRTVYRYMDIGTAKPTKAEQALVPHHGIDLVEPGERFTVADFKTYTEQKIEEVRGRGHVPFLVGGTGLYIDAVLYDYKFGGRADESMRQKLENKSLDDLYNYCKTNNITIPENDKNKRYVIRAIEQHGSRPSRQNTPRQDAVIVGIATDKEVLRSRIAGRAEHLFEDGVVGEAKLLGEKYGWKSEAMTGNIYRLVHEFLQGAYDEAELKQRFVYSDWHLAKRQLTWLKRSSDITWLSLDDAKDYINAKLSPA